MHTTTARTSILCAHRTASVPVMQSSEGDEAILVTPPRKSIEVERIDQKSAEKQPASPHMAEPPLSTDATGSWCVVLVGFV